MMRVPWPIMASGVALGVWAATRSRDERLYTTVMLDRREEAWLTENAQRHYRKRNERPWALVLHQMGFSRGNDPERYDGVTSHYKILPNGVIVQSWDWDDRLPASSAFNAGSWAVEFAGNFPSKSGSEDPEDYWRPERFGMDQLTDAQVQSGRWLVDHLIPQGLTTILAHRQGDANRQIDPGPDVWREVGQWAVGHRGLSDGGPGFAAGGGLPIPDDWRGDGAPKVA